MAEDGGRRYIQLDDVARELGLSKSTVSRAISGKGRVGADTRRLVLAYIDAHEYRPNRIASGLAKSRTYNIGAVLPTDAFRSEVPFFQNALLGMCLLAQQQDYDVVVTSASDTDITFLQRMIRNRKVDGVVLTRSVLDDPCITYLQDAGVPFVLIGTSESPSVASVDTDTLAAAQELTRRLLARGFRQPAYLSGSSRYLVNRSRLRGFFAGAEAGGVPVEGRHVFENLACRADIVHAAHVARAAGADCFVCGDDNICCCLLEHLADTDAAFSTRRVASLYNSVLLEAFRPAVMAVDVDAHALGGAAAARLLTLLEPDLPLTEKTDCSGRYHIVDR